MECPRTGKNGGPARPAAGPSRQQGPGACVHWDHAGRTAEPARMRNGAADATCEQQLLHAHDDRAAVIDPRRRDLSRRSSSARSSGRGAGPRGSRGLAAGCRSCTCRRCRWSVRFGRLPGGLVPGSWRPVRPPGPAGTSPTGFGNPRALLRSTTRSPDRAAVALVASGYPTVPPGVAKVLAGQGRRATRFRPRWGMSPTLGGRPSGRLHRRCDTDEVDGRGPVFLRDGSGSRAGTSLVDPHFLIPSLITGKERHRRCRAGGPPVLMRSCSPRVAVRCLAPVAAGRPPGRRPRSPVWLGYHHLLFLPISSTAGCSARNSRARAFTWLTCGSSRVSGLPALEQVGRAEQSAHGRGGEELHPGQVHRPCARGHGRAHDHIEPVHVAGFDLAAHQQPVRDDGGLPKVIDDVSAVQSQNLVRRISCRTPPTSRTG